MNPIATILEKQPILVLDGAFATELERAGFGIHDPLWSAVALYRRPDLVRAVHRSYLDAGADVVTTASYQATAAGFMEKGFSREEAETLIVRSVTLAREAREEFLAGGIASGRARPLVAASVGPYGAYLADGSEYTGDYGVSRKELAAFHRERAALLWSASPDLLACETVPCLLEAEALADVLAAYPAGSAWISFSCRDGGHTCGGDAIESCAAFLDGVPQVAAVGINCTAPDYAVFLIERIRTKTDKPVAVYPNSGEIYDPLTKTWAGSPVSYGTYIKRWKQAGARLIGGCCRTTPAHIREVRALMKTEG